MAVSEVNEVAGSPSRLRVSTLFIC
jgi:hypothetical protein